MIRINHPAVAMSIQDLGRIGYGSEGYCRSGAMDRSSLAAANRLAGASRGSAAIELGPSPCSIEIIRSGTIAFGGAMRDGAPWWSTLTAKPGDRFDLSAPNNGVWSYIAMAGGVASPLFLGSRSTCVRESVGSWIRAGDILEAAAEAVATVDAQSLPMSGQVRFYGDLPLDLKLGTQLDRMGYQLLGAFPAGSAEKLSEPTMPGFVQVLPSGDAFILMAEAPTVGGYPVCAVIHEEDLRIVAQARTGTSIQFIRA